MLNNQARKLPSVTQFKSFGLVKIIGSTNVMIQITETFWQSCQPISFAGQVNIVAASRIFYFYFVVFNMFAMYCS